MGFVDGISSSQKVWNLFLQVVTDAEEIGSWTPVEMTEVFKDVIALNYDEYFEKEISTKNREEFGENIIFGLSHALRDDFESGHQHFLFLLCCCFYYGVSQ